MADETIDPITALEIKLAKLERQVIIQRAELDHYRGGAYQPAQPAPAPTAASPKVEAPAPSVGPETPEQEFNRLYPGRSTLDLLRSAEGRRAVDKLMNDQKIWATGTHPRQVEYARLQAQQTREQSQQQAQQRAAEQQQGEPGPTLAQQAAQTDRYGGLNANNYQWIKANMAEIEAAAAAGQLGPEVGYFEVERPYTADEGIKALHDSAPKLGGSLNDTYDVERFEGPSGGAMRRGKDPRTIK